MSLAFLEIQPKEVKCTNRAQLRSSLGSERLSHTLEWHNFTITREGERAPAASSTIPEMLRADPDAEEAGEQELQQLVLYDDKAKLAHEAVEDKVKIKKAKKVKQRSVVDWDAYRRGNMDAHTVNLCAKTLPAPSSRCHSTQNEAAGASGSGKGCPGAVQGAAAKMTKSSAGKEQVDPARQKAVGGCSGPGKGRGRPVLGNTENV